ncbi:hypothetical protein IW967_14575 [Alicyclobacillus mali]|uniref:Acid shock protein n=1 Tax=Alicyclobacillus mali (ex Roth et al. 2021) TaxID=1123961 RepID=A0ABS0F727_9BACL|nr:hypothetical protein [Alicyclobacillus mali (ex Roth et al. 2021)]MBF8379073.1 hypothetical protein [Alicyclobacillus mali (ex Roth et al. 2021)]MCL6487590.1 hypothetical protein [Alicyclobacillus mali (ex Roth et al. 2021)]
MKKSILASVAALTLFAAPSVAFAGTEKTAHPAHAVVHVHKTKKSATHKATATKKSTKTAPKKTVAKKQTGHKAASKSASKSKSKKK